MLPVFLHTVGLLCLHELTKDCADNRFLCPMCKTVNTVPPGGVEAFPTDRFVFNAAQKAEELDRGASCSALRMRNTSAPCRAVPCRFTDCA